MTPTNHLIISLLCCASSIWTASVVQGFSVDAGSRIFVGTPSNPRKRLALDYMSSTPVLLKPGMSVDDAMELFLRHSINGAAVVDEETGETLMGVLSSFDFLQKEAFEGALLPMEGSVEQVERYVHAAQRICGQTVADIMTSVDDLQTITADTPMREAAAIMSQHKLHRLPVVAKPEQDKEETGGPVLVGMLTADHVMQDLVHIVNNLPPANEDTSNDEEEDKVANLTP